MTELAHKLWPFVTDRAAAGAAAAAPVVTELEAAALRLDRGAEIWTRGSEQARIELLADVLYREPRLARDALRVLRADSGYVGPTFIVQLAAKALSVRPRTDAAAGALDALIDDLIGDPPRVLALAREFEMAVPFALVLQQELDEIEASRRRRLERDAEAEAARLRRELEEAQRTLQWHRETRGTAAGRTDATSAPASTLREFELQQVVYAVERELERVCREREVGRETAATTAAGGTAPAEPRTPSGHPLRRAQEAELLGLAFSGGGIRSATFNLGVLQALADLDLLRRVDYLSTVSGGGYIGSWLAAWSKRRGAEGVRAVQRSLSPARSPDPAAADARPLHWLREYSNYLTPKLGFFSADSWTMFATWLRNALLNQTVLVLLLAAALLLPRAIVPPLFFEISTGTALGIGAALLFWSSMGIGINLRSFDLARPPGRPAPTAQGQVQFLVVLPCFLAAFFLTKPLLEGYSGKVGIPTWLVLSTCLFLIQIFSRSDRCFYPHDTKPRGWPLAKAGLGMAAASIAAGVTGASVLTLFARACGAWAGSNNNWKGAGPWHAITFGPPLIILTLSLSATVQIGLLGRNFPDERREWWSRLGAWTLIYSFGWIALCGTAVYGPWALANLGAWLSAVGVTWIASTAGGVLTARSAQESATAAGPKLTVPAFARRALAIMAPYIFIVGLLFAIALGLVFLLLQLAPPADWSAAPSLARLAARYWDYTAAEQYGQPLVLLVIGLAGSFLLAWRVDVNEFSMHHFYKNRLVRCYLGASRPPGGRQPNRFTGFDRRDDVGLAELRVSAREPYVGPYPIINAALNLVKGDNLAWQERKATSFVFTPWFSGYEPADATSSPPTSMMARDGYRPTERYAYPEGGIGLGTAAAISGAAANPNMGYHSSPAASFLMTIFNARLGWWLGNPRHEWAWQKSSPTLGLLYHFNELAGNTSDRSWFVNLSDGGHFENLGLYELVRRRCRYIIVCDSEQDAMLGFGGLGNAIRKCRTDFGVDIDISPERIRLQAEPGRPGAHCVVGTITYPDNGGGKLLYLKASLTGDEPADVVEYHKRQPAFPHETTGDQWFDESQFESYRALGHHAAVTALRRAAEARTSIDSATGTVQPAALFDYLESLWFPPSAAVEAHFGEHTEAYGRLLERMRTDATLEDFDAVLFPDLAGTLGIPLPPASRNRFYTYAEMLELMQRVFIDLDFENNGTHPHNAGWVRIFHQWASDAEFRKAWNATKKTYSERFRRFCESELNLPA